LQTIKRITDLANIGHQLDLAVDQSIETIIEAESAAAFLEKSQMTQNEVATARLKLTHYKISSSGGLNIFGFFILGRIMVLAIIGQIITYLIIMIEFKTEEDPEKLGYHSW